MFTVDGEGGGGKVKAAVPERLPAAPVVLVPLPVTEKLSAPPSAVTPPGSVVPAPTVVPPAVVTVLLLLELTAMEEVPRALWRSDTRLCDKLTVAGPSGVETCDVGVEDDTDAVVVVPVVVVPGAVWP